MRKMKFLAFPRGSEITRREWRERKRRRSFAFFFFFALLVGDDTQLMAARCAVSPVRLVFENLGRRYVRRVSCRGSTRFRRLWKSRHGRSVLLSLRAWTVIRNNNGYIPVMYPNDPTWSTSTLLHEIQHVSWNVCSFEKVVLISIIFNECLRFGLYSGICKSC